VCAAYDEGVVQSYSSLSVQLGAAVHRLPIGTRLIVACRMYMCHIHIERRL